MSDFDLRCRELYEYIEALVERFVVLQSGILDKAASNLSFQQIKVVGHVGKFQPCTMSELAERTRLSMSTMTGIVDKLVAGKLVRRYRSDADRRVVNVKLTARGMEIYEMEVKNHLELAKAMLNALPEPEQLQLIALLKKINSTV